MSRFSGSVLLLLIMASLSSFEMIAGLTNTQDVNMLLLVRSQFGNNPSTWKSGDPCDSKWDGVSCTGSRITSLLLSSINLTGQLPHEIGYLSALRILDLSHNPGLTGPIPSSLGMLQQLQAMILTGCSFNGRIPEELGNLPKLLTLDVNSNGLSGSIPPSLGNLTELFWFDIGNNSIGGQLPVELKRLVKCVHFHFNKNQLSGSIPPEIFHEYMILEHLLFDSNLFNGEIPTTIGTVSTLTIVRLDRNSFEGPIPSSIQQLGKLIELHLSKNQLSGSIPDLSGMSKLLYLDLSHNPFQVSEVPTWLPTLDLLNTIVLENTTLNGYLPPEVFNLPQLETVKLSNNSIDGSLKIETTFSKQLQWIDVRYNKIKYYDVGSGYDHTLLLEGNPVCDTTRLVQNLCHSSEADQPYYQTDMSQCGNHIIRCPEDFLKVNPGSCECAMPYVGIMVFRAPTFSILTNDTRFQNLENSLWTTLNLTKGSVYICCISLDATGYLNIQVQLFPQPGRKYFKPLELLTLAYALSSQKYTPPPEFGPYYFRPTEFYNFWDEGQTGSQSLSSGAIVGIAIGASVLIFAIIALGIYSLWQRKKAAKAVEISNPFASWGTVSGGDSGDAPKLKGARYFSLQELKMATNNFSKHNEIGSGGYGKVYKGILPVEGQVVAVKRNKEESQQCSAEFKTELEMLSRVHHKNLVELIGFCFERGSEHMLVYEYMPNGSLRDNLSCKTGIRLDWRKRICIALGSARGLAYLHEHADPPIIHRDVKSNNILLDENLNAKVTDFGLSKILADTRIGATQVKGTMGYLDPEYCLTQQLTEKSDVYSFGVVLVELLASRPPLVGRGKYLIREMKTAMDTGGINAVRGHILDPFLIDSPVPGTVLESFVSLSLRCVEDLAVNRPKMSDVVKELELIVESLGRTDTATTETQHAESPTVSLWRADYHHVATTSSSSFDDSGGFVTRHPIVPK